MGRSKRTLDQAELLRREMMTAGERLKQALMAESVFGFLRPGATDDIRKQWQECRRTVERVGEEYITAIRRWRTALEDTVEREATQRGKLESNARRKPLKPRQAT